MTAAGCVCFYQGTAVCSSPSLLVCGSVVVTAKRCHEQQQREPISLSFSFLLFLSLSFSLSSLVVSLVSLAPRCHDMSVVLLYCCAGCRPEDFNCCIPFVVCVIYTYTLEDQSTLPRNPSWGGHVDCCYCCTYVSYDIIYTSRAAAAGLPVLSYCCTAVDRSLPDCAQEFQVSFPKRFT